MSKSSTPAHKKQDVGKWTSRMRKLLAEELEAEKQESIELLKSGNDEVENSTTILLFADIVTGPDCTWLMLASLESGEY